MIAIPVSKSNIIFNAEWQDTSKTKGLDALQNLLNSYNKIAFENDYVVEKLLKTKELIEAKKNDLITKNHQFELLSQELKCEEIDSCKKNLNKKIESLKKQKKVLKNDIDSLNGNIVINNKLSIEIQRRQEAEANKIQQNTAEITGSRKVKYKGGWYYLFIVDMDSCELLMHHRDSLTKRPYKTIDNVYKALSKSKLNPLMITNAGMYTHSFEPQGLYIEQFKELYPVDTTRPNNDNFYLKPNGVFYLDQLNKPYVNTTEDFLIKYRSKSVKVKFATQSGPMLLINGKIHPVFTVNSNNRKIRSGIGIINNKKVVFAISLDEVNFYDFANLFKDLFNCKDALFLDGAISRMFLSDKAPQEKGGNFGPIISVVKRTK